MPRLCNQRSARLPSARAGAPPVRRAACARRARPLLPPDDGAREGELQRLIDPDVDELSDEIAVALEEDHAEAVGAALGRARGFRGFPGNAGSASARGRAHFPRRAGSPRGPHRAP